MSSGVQKSSDWEQQQKSMPLLRLLGILALPLSHLIPLAIGKGLQVLPQDLAELWPIVVCAFRHPHTPISPVYLFTQQNVNLFTITITWTCQKNTPDCFLQRMHLLNHKWTLFLAYQVMQKDVCIIKKNFRVDFFFNMQGKFLLNICKHWQLCSFPEVHHPYHLEVYFSRLVSNCVYFYLYCGDFPNVMRSYWI